MGKGIQSQHYLHAWRLRLVVVQVWVSTHKAAHLPDNPLCILDELSEINEHHAAKKPVFNIGCAESTYVLRDCKRSERLRGSQIMGMGSTGDRAHNNAAASTNSDAWPTHNEYFGLAGRQCMQVPRTVQS